VAYRTDINTRDRSGAIAAVVAIHALLLLALLHLTRYDRFTDEQPALTTIDLPIAPPPPPQRREPERPKRREGGSAPRNIRSEATPVVAPQPKIITPPVQIAASETPRQGFEPTQGASEVRGPGTGAGGRGQGTGSGNGGNGEGAGGEVAEAPRLVTPVLYGRDFPSEMIEQWPGRATVFMRLRIDPRGTVSGCTVDRGTGVSSIDSRICNLAHERLRFRPALDRNGQAVAGWFGYAQPAPL
jgi:protein TonB